MHVRKDTVRFNAISRIKKSLLNENAVSSQISLCSSLSRGETSFKQKIQLKRKMSSLIILPRLHRLICDDI